MMEQMTEETEWEDWTEETMPENSRNDIGVRALFLTFFSSGSGWFLPRPQGDNGEIPGYLWLYSAAFHVISIAIWIEILVTSIQKKESKRTIETHLIILGVSFLSSFAFFLYFHGES